MSPDGVAHTRKFSPVLRWNTSTPLTLTWIWSALSPFSWTGMISMSGSPKMTNRLPSQVFFRVSGNAQVGVRARLEHGDAPELAELRRVRHVAGRAGDQHVVVGVGGLAGGDYQSGAGDGVELGPMKTPARRSVPVSASPLAERPRRR